MAGMKPRFSILTLLGVTLWAAMSFAALKYPSSAWSFAVVCAFGVVLLAASVAAAQPRSVFSRGFLFAAIAYSSVSLANEALWDIPGGRLPHHFFAQIVTGELPPGTAVGSEEHFDFVFRENQSLRVGFCNASLAVGFVGDSLALWRYRVLERQTKAN